MIEHLDGREKALESLGWRGPEAEWIALVCLHSGIFTRSQFCDYFDARANRAHRFVQALPGSRGRPSSPPLQLSPEGRRVAEYSARESTRRWGWRTSDTGGRRQSTS